MSARPQDQRTTAITTFLQAGPWRGSARAPLAGDASNRRYERLTHPSRGPAVLMDAPPEKGEDIAPFVEMTHRLRHAGLSAPAVLQADQAHGLMLLEDLGDALFARVLAAGQADEEMLYATAIDLLAALHALPDGAEGLRPYDAATYAAEAALLTDWYLPAASDAPVDPAPYQAALATALAPLADAPPVCVLRDYHAENLLWLPERNGLARVGLLDYQDALAGHPAYDIVSLLEDARRDTSATLRTAMQARYAAATGTDAEALALACAALGAQRNLKIVGIFARLWLRDGKQAYLALIPRAWDHLIRDLAHPHMAGLRAWVAAHVPPPTPAVLDRLRTAR